MSQAIANVADGQSDQSATTSRIERLQSLEARIETNKRAFMQVGMDLAEIQSNLLYRESGYKSWNQYCQDRWGFTGRNGYFQIGAALVAMELETDVPAQNEFSVRPLTLDGLSSEARNLIWNRAAADPRSTGSPTGKIVTEHRDRFIVEACPYEYVKESVNNCSLPPKDAAALIVALDSAPNRAVRDSLEKAEIKDKSLVLDLVRLYNDGSSTFGEVMATRHIQLEDKSIPLDKARVGDLRVLLDIKAKEHRAAAQAERDADKKITAISLVVYRNDPRATYRELQRALTTDDMRGLKTILNAANV